MQGTPMGSGYGRNAARVALGTTVTAIALAAGAGQASADKIDVTTKAPDGRGSFAAAVKKANHRTGGDQIRFAKNLKGKIDLPEEVVTLEGTVVIKGNGYGDPEGSKFRRVVLSGHRGGSELAVDRDGKASLRGLYFDGVSLTGSRSALSVQDSFVDGERTVDETGISGSGKLRILGTTVQGFDRGVTIGFTGRIDESTIADNVGGGGVVVGNNASADVSNTTISGNVVDGGQFVAGGGLATSNYDSTARVVNSTIARNQAISNTSTGGGLFGDVEVNNSTIVANRAVTGAGVAGSPAGDADVGNSIVYGNTGFDSNPQDCAKPFTSSGGNLIGTPGDCLLDAADLSGVDPLLGPLSDNGGPTQTIPIGAGSPAIGLAVEATAAKFDQRGVKRSSNPDAGAFERKG